MKNGRKMRNRKPYKWNHRNRKNQEITEEFLTYLDKRIDKDFKAQRDNLTKLIASYTCMGLKRECCSLNNQIMVNTVIPDDITPAELQMQFRSLAEGLAEAVLNEMASDRTIGRDIFETHERR